MKKLVTLSAIAMAGATLGVGSTFGWWSDGSEEEADKAKAKSSDAKIVEKVVSDFDSDGAQDVLISDLAEVKVSVKSDGKADDVVENVLVFTPKEDGKSVDKAEHKKKIVAAHRTASEMEHLVAQLEKEASEMEAAGQADAAAIQRKLIGRIRDTLKTSQADVFFKAAHGAGLRLSVPAHDIDQKLSAKVKELAERSKQLAQVDAHRKVEAEVQAQLQHILSHQNAVVAAHQEERARKVKAESLDAVKRDMQQKLVEIQRHQGGQVQRIASELREVAERLEKEGRQERAREIRGQVEQLLQGAEGKSERMTITLGDDVQLQPSGHLHVFKKRGEIARNRDERDAGDAPRKDGFVYRDREDRHPDARPRDPEHHEGHHPDQHPEHREIHIRHMSPPGGPQLGELHKVLHELRHEIGELREEVRGLRHLLNRDGDRDDHDEDEGRSERRKRDPRLDSKKFDDAREGKHKEGKDDDDKPGKKAKSDGEKPGKQDKDKGDDVKPGKQNKDRDDKDEDDEEEDDDGDDREGAVEALDKVRLEVKEIVEEALDKPEQDEASSEDAADQSEKGEASSEDAAEKSEGPQEAVEEVEVKVVE